MEELGFEFPIPLTLETDNVDGWVPATANALKTKQGNIDSRQGWVLELKDREIGTPVHIPTLSNVADICNKILSTAEFKRLQTMCMSKSTATGQTTGMSQHRLN